MHKIKLIPARIKWSLKILDLALKNKNSKFKKIVSKEKELKAKFLQLDKQIVKAEAYKVAKAEYDLISYVIKCLKE